MEKFAPSMKKREEKTKVPSRDPAEDLVTAEHPQPHPQREHQPPNISEMKPLTREAYGGGMYADEGPAGGRGPSRPPASVTQSADGPEEASMAATPGTKPNRPPPPSTGDRDLDITGLSYIQ